MKKRKIFNEKPFTKHFICKNKNMYITGSFYTYITYVKKCLKKLD